MAHLPRRPVHLRAERRRLGARLELGVGRRDRRRVVRDPLRLGRQDRRRVPHPRGHQHQLRGRPDAVGHVDVVRGARRRPGVGVRSARPATGAEPPGDGPLQARGRRGRPDRPAPVPDRGPARRLPLPLHPHRVRRPLQRHAGGDGRLARPGGHLGAGPRPERDQRGHPRPGRRGGALQRRRGRLVRQRDRLLLDQGRQPDLVVQHARRTCSTCSTTGWPRPQRGSPAWTTSPSRARATCSGARTTATRSSRSGSSPASAWPPAS